MNSHTPYPEVNALLHVLLPDVQAVLGDQFVGLYVEGSLANGDFDEDSDIDFVTVTATEIGGDLFSALQAMHDRLATMDSPYAVELEGSYVSQRAIRRYDPALALHPNLERGKGERLKPAHHDEGWIVHQHILRERGIVLAGPPPHTLIDPVSASDLRRAMPPVLSGWATEILHHPDRIAQRGYQSYVVLSLCRILYTLELGDVVSKRVAARWAQACLEERWKRLIEQAWEGRHHPTLAAPAEAVNETLAFIRYAVEGGPAGS